MARVWDTPTTQVNTAAATSASGTHVIGSGINRAVWMVLWNGGTGLTPSSVPKFGNRDMTILPPLPFNASPIFTDLRIYVQVNPMPGTIPWTVPFTGSVTSSIAIFSCDLVNQVTPCDAVDTDTTANHTGTSSATTTSETGDEVIDVLATGGITGGGSFTVGAGQTIMANLFNSTEQHAVGVSRKDGAASVTMTWDMTSGGSDVGLYQVQFNINTDEVPYGAQVVRAATGTISDGFGNTCTTSINATGGDLLLLIGSWRNNSGQTLASLTWNGVGVTILTSEQTAPFSYVVGYVKNPTQTTANAVLTTAGGAQRIYVMGYALVNTDAVSYLGTPVESVDLSATATSATSASFQLRGSPPNLAIDMIVNRDQGTSTAYTAGTSQTKVDEQVLGELRQVTSVKPGVKGPTTMSFSWTSADEYKYLALAVNANVVPPADWSNRPRSYRPAVYRPGRAR